MVILVVGVYFLVESFVNTSTSVLVVSYILLILLGVYMGCLLIESILKTRERCSQEEEKVVPTDSQTKIKKNEEHNRFEHTEEDFVDPNIEVIKLERKRPHNYSGSTGISQQKKKTRSLTPIK